MLKFSHGIISATVLSLVLCANASGMEPIEDNDLGFESAIEKNIPNQPRGINPGVAACNRLDLSKELREFTQRSAKHHTDEQIRKTMDKHAENIHARYQSALLENPCVSGMMILTITLSPSGFPLDIQHRSEGDGMQVVANKIASVLMNVNFGAAEEQDIFDYRLYFQPLH